MTTTECAECARLDRTEEAIKRSARISWEGVTSARMRLGEQRRQHAVICMNGGTS